MSPILTLEEAAELLRVRPQWLQRSDCPRLRIGGHVRYDREQVIQWARNHSTAEAA